MNSTLGFKLGRLIPELLLSSSNPSCYRELGMCDYFAVPSCKLVEIGTLHLLLISWCLAGPIRTTGSRLRGTARSEADERAIGGRGGCASAGGERGAE